MAERSNAPARDGNGAIDDAADLAGGIVAQPIESFEAVPATHRDASTLDSRLDRLAQELAESRLRSEHLEATLAERASRVQQLIGERDRLVSLLAARDQEMLRLSREIGALTARAAPAARRSPALLGAAKAMLERLRDSRKAPLPGKPERARPTTEPSAERPLLPWLESRPPTGVLAVVVFGLSEAEIESVLGIVERRCAERDLAPLLLTDNDTFELFRGRRVLFEFLPARAEQERFAADLDWQLFTLRRLALIRRKWQPVQVVAFGRAAVEAVQSWLDSPFETAPIPASLKGRSEAAGLDVRDTRQPFASRP